MATISNAENLEAKALGIEIQPLSIHIGAEIRGVDISRPLSDGQRKAVWQAFLQHKVIFFRDQTLDHRSQVAFARQFAPLTPAHILFGGDAEFPEIYPVAKNRTANSNRSQTTIRPWTGWHADITPVINPPMASILRADLVPPFGGDTQWTNLVAAYRSLSPAMQAFLHKLRGIHRFGQAGVKGNREYEERVQRNVYVSEHPIVRVHPETGERALYVAPSYLKTIVGLAPSESQALCEMLWEHIVRPEYTVRFRWQPGSVAMWDNRATCHLAPRDIFDAEFDRLFFRVTLLGDTPKGVDGKASVSIEGAPVPSTDTTTES